MLQDTRGKESRQASLAQRSKYSLKHYSPLVPQRILGEEGRKNKEKGAKKPCAKVWIGR